MTKDEFEIQVRKLKKHTDSEGYGRKGIAYVIMMRGENPDENEIYYDLIYNIHWYKITDFVKEVLKSVISIINRRN